MSNTGASIEAGPRQRPQNDNRGSGGGSCLPVMVFDGFLHGDSRCMEQVLHFFGEWRVILICGLWRYIRITYIKRFWKRHYYIKIFIKWIFSRDFNIDFFENVTYTIAEIVGFKYCWISKMIYFIGMVLNSSILFIYKHHLTGQCYISILLELAI